MKAQPGHTRCRRCGARLAADNTSVMCGPCGRNDEHASAPVVADNFWDAVELREAFEARDFGRVLQAYRRAAGSEVTQAHVADWLGLTQGQISRIERGTTRANDLGKIHQWATALGIPQRCLWFTLSIESPDAYRSNTAASSLPLSNEAEGDEVQRRRFLKATTGAGASIVGGSLLSGGRTRQSVPVPRNTVGGPDVDMVREMTSTFRRVDNRYGGGHGHVRAAVRSYLESAAEPLLRNGRSTSKVEVDLLCATAELYQLAGWMAFDTGQLKEGRGYLRKALRLCNDAGSDALAAEMLAAMSHHAAFFSVTNKFFSATDKLKSGTLGSDSAVDLALAARQNAKRSGLWALQAEAAAMEAHGLALQRDKQGSLAALRDAERAFDRVRDQDVPAWLKYFDAAYLAAKFAHTLRDLGCPGEAEDFARRSLEMSEGYDRGRLFNTVLLASILADQGKVEEACTVGSKAVQMTGAIRSVRTASNLADLGQRLEGFRRTSAVIGLYKQMSEHGIPTPRT
jgi:transcriptional regulator with XRE-family HTH domain/tetratricopeptide (TPR) repeat protein